MWPNLEVVSFTKISTNNSGQISFFSKMWTVLLYKIIDGRIDGKLYFAIKHIYQMTESSVQVNVELTDWFIINRGVRQGDTLSTTHFLLYINDLANNLKELNI